MLYEEKKSLLVLNNSPVLTAVEYLESIVTALVRRLLLTLSLFCNNSLCLHKYLYYSTDSREVIYNCQIKAVTGNSSYSIIVNTRELFSANEL